MNTETKSARIYLKAPEQKWLWRGCIAACALPVLCGILLMIFSYFGTRAFDPTSASFTLNLVLLAIPATGALLAACLGTYEICQKNQHGFSGKASFVWIALKAGFFAHWFIAGCLFLLMLFFGGVGIFGNGLYIFIKAVVLGSYYTLLLWGLLTLPLSLMCGFIFWLVAVRGSKNLMAEVFD